jgi:hypothetical protein
MTTQHQHNEFRQIAGQLIMIRFPGTVLDAATADFIKANSIRAVCLFRGNMSDSEQLGKLTADLRAVMGPKALIASTRKAAPWCARCGCRRRRRRWRWARPTTPTLARTSAPPSRAPSRRWASTGTSRRCWT